MNIQQAKLLEFQNFLKNSEYCKWRMEFFAKFVKILLRGQRVIYCYCSCRVHFMAQNLIILQSSYNLYNKCNLINKNKSFLKIQQAQNLPPLQTQKRQQHSYTLGSKKFLFFKFCSFIQDFQYVFKFTYLMATILSAVLLHKVYQFQTMPEFDQVRQGTVVDFLYYTIPFGIAFTIFDIAIHYLFDGLCEKYYLDEVKYKGKSRMKRAYTLVKWAYSVGYYFISSIAAYLILKDTNYLPTWLGGSGSCSNQFLNAPSLPAATYAMKVFYLLQLGKHASRLVSHMFIRQQGNYYEYVLHHSLSTFLIFFSYLTNQWLVGIMVLLCHDISDLFLIMGRGYKDYKRYSKKLLQVIYVLAVGTWIVSRLIVFPICCVYTSLVGAGQISQSLTDIQRQVLMLPYRWMAFMLVFLLMLQGFWTYYIGKAFVEVNVSAKIASNTYE